MIDALLTQRKIIYSSQKTDGTYQKSDKNYLTPLCMGVIIIESDL